MKKPTTNCPRGFTNHAKVRHIQYGKGHFFCSGILFDKFEGEAEPYDVICLCSKGLHGNDMAVFAPDEIVCLIDSASSALMEYIDRSGKISSLRETATKWLREQKKKKSGRRKVTK